MLAACNTDEIDLPILEVRDVKKVSLVLITGDRGSFPFSSMGKILGSSQEISRHFSCRAMRWI